MTVAIEVEDVSKRFDATLALKEVTLAVEAGKVLALLGPNGAGKTTLVRVLTTLLLPDSGLARVAGFDVRSHAREIRSVIGLAGQYASVDELLTGRENLELVGLLYHLSKAEYRRRATDALDRMSLVDAGDQLVKTYSGGMRRRLDLAASLVGRPPVLFLDEPTNGLDPRTRNDLWEFIKDLVAEGTTVLLTTQFMDEAEHLADGIVVMDAGRIVAEGTANELKDQFGGNMLEVRVTNRGDLERATELIGRLGSQAPRIDAQLNHVSLPIAGSTDVLIAAGRVLDDHGIALETLEIRRPSLDDVFLAITSHAANAMTPLKRGNRWTGMTEPVPQPPTIAAPSVTLRLALRDIKGITKRNLLRIIRTPQQMFFSVVQPTIILLVFRYVLGGAIHIPGVDYVDFIVPGVFLEAVLVGGMTTSVALAQDLQLGMIDRFRSLPMARGAFLIGRTLADLSRSVMALTFIICLGLLVGFRFHNGVLPCLAGVGLIIAFGYALTWVYATVGLAVKDPQTAQMAAILPMFILFFASSALVPVATMPGWLQPFTRNQPATVTIDSVRALLEGGLVYHELWLAVLWCVVIVIGSVMLSLTLYRRATA